MTITTKKAEECARGQDSIKESSQFPGYRSIACRAAATIRSLVAERDALQARVAELEEVLSGLLKTFEGLGFRIGKTYPPRTASYEEAEQHYAKNYQGETALFMYQQWCQWRLACMARATLEGKKDE